MRLISKRIAKSYKTVFTETLCMLTSLMHIIIQAKEIIKLYEPINNTAGKQQNMGKGDIEPKYYSHSVDAIKINEEGLSNTNPCQLLF